MGLCGFGSVSCAADQRMRKNRVVALPAALQTAIYKVFLSSGADVLELRDRTEKLCQIASALLSRHGLSSRLEIERWEDAPPHVVTTGHLNAEFVARALASHMVVALLRDELRPGTLEELEAVLEEGGIELAVFCFEPERERSPELVTFLNSRKHQIVYKEVGPPESDDAWYELVRSVVDLTIQVIVGDSGFGAYVDRY